MRIGFNPRPRTGGDIATAQAQVAHCQVSIRAPARGATALKAGLLRPSGSFNPRPRTGGDTWLRTLRIRWECFNPRPRTGGD